MDLAKLIMIVGLGLYIVFTSFMAVSGLMDMSTSMVLVGGAIVFLVLNIVELKRKLLRKKREFAAEDAAEDERVVAAAANIVDQYKEAGTKDLFTINSAATLGDLPKLKGFLKKNADLLEFKDGNGKTPLLCSLEAGYENVIEFLINKGANIRVRDGRNRTPLHYAVENCSVRIVELLISNGASINEPDREGQVPLNSAMKLGKKDLEGILIKHGAFLKVQTEVKRKFPKRIKK